MQTRKVISTIPVDGLPIVENQKVGRIPLELDFDMLSKMLTRCTVGYVSHELAKHQQELLDLERSTNDTSKNRTHKEDDNKTHRDKGLLLERKIREKQNLLATMAIFNPKEQTDFVTLGSGVHLKINEKTQEKPFFYDSVCEGTCTQIISMQSPLGKALFGKRTGYKGSYVAGEGRTFTFEVMEIIAHTPAKEIIRGPKPEKSTSNKIEEKEALVA